MDGKWNFIDAMKKSMGMQKTQRFAKGIRGDDIARYLHKLKQAYKDQGRMLKYTWKKVEGNRNVDKKQFSGKHVERIGKRKTGRYILFGKAAWKNPPHVAFMKRMRKQENEKDKFKIFGKRANGAKRADHAVSIRIDVDGKFLYDNAFKKTRKEFCVDVLANQMEDISYCFVFDISEEF